MSINELRNEVKQISNNKHNHQYYFDIVKKYRKENPKISIENIDWMEDHIGELSDNAIECFNNINIFSDDELENHINIASNYINIINELMNPQTIMKMKPLVKNISKGDNVLMELLYS